MTDRRSKRKRAPALLIVVCSSVIVAACGSPPRSPRPPGASGPAFESGVLPLAVAPTPQALLVVGSATLVPGDTALKTRLSANLGFAVTVKDGTSATSLDATGKTLVVISESVTDNYAVSPAVVQVGTKFKSSQVPVVVLEPQLFGVMALTSTTQGTNF